MDPKNDCGFRCIKMFLIIIYALTAIVAIVALITTSIDLASLKKAQISYSPEKYAHLTRSKLSRSKMLLNEF